MMRHNLMTPNDWKIWNDFHNGKNRNDYFYDPEIEMKDELRRMVEKSGSGMTVRSIWNAAFAGICIALLVCTYIALSKFGLF